jgi:hypothetical protein
MSTLSFSPRVVRLLLVVLAAVATAAMVHGHFFAGPITARADGKDGPRRAVTGTQTLTAGQAFTILAHKDKVEIGNSG